MCRLRRPASELLVHLELLLGILLMFISVKRVGIRAYFLAPGRCVGFVFVEGRGFVGIGMFGLAM